MALSAFDIFKIGIGPSSSHSMGPMLAAGRFLHRLEEDGHFDAVASLRLELFGSLGHTGKGHGSDVAVLMGLEGEHPETVDTEAVAERMEAIRTSGTLHLGGRRRIECRPSQQLVFHKRKSLPEHPNGMRFTALGADGEELQSRVYYSIGGGFVVNAGEAARDELVPDHSRMPNRFSSGDDLLALSLDRGKSIATLQFENELTWRPEGDVREGLRAIWSTMDGCIERGCRREGVLPGGLKVPRRAPALKRRLHAAGTPGSDPLAALDWVNLWALAVNEENAAGGRIVTAPTNGAAGILPAVLRYYLNYLPGADEDGVERFLLTAAAIGILYVANASISGAEVGCQGEVGVACSMAAAGLTEVLGGTTEQVENAAEIGMEHNLGLTCDPVGGLVQVPCIERNAMGAVKAINAARLAMRGDGRHAISLDKVIRTMRQTGADMKLKYKETARGGLAVNVIEC
jgi:L-serine dehydratase